MEGILLLCYFTGGYIFREAEPLRTKKFPELSMYVYIYTQ